MSTTIRPCYPLIELLRYADANGIPSKVGVTPGEPYPDEEAVLVAVPSRVLKALRALADGYYDTAKKSTPEEWSIIRKVARIEETVIADGFTDSHECEEARQALERMKRKPVRRR